MRYLPFLVLAFLIACNNPQNNQPRIVFDLSGDWQFALDTANTGVENEWYLSSLDDHIELPGTTDLRQKGFRNLDTTTLHLNRLFKYEGPAWYRKKIVIPENFKNKHIVLHFERSKSSIVWVDSIRVGASQLLQSPQEFDLSNYLSPGVHYLTVQVNNDLSLTPYGNVHIYSDDTQTNWNGIIGKMYLEASEKTYISNLQLFPDIDANKIVIELEVANELKLDELTVDLWVEKIANGQTQQLKPQQFKLGNKNKVKLEYLFDEAPDLWSEFEQPIYQLTAHISSGNVKDAQTVTFGMRDFSVQGTQFSINGQTTFLRGKHESAVFPITGFAPMNVEEWVRVYKIAKSYGINHYRFHSYCPPEAAFIAADQEGIYLQVELPFWGGLASDNVAKMLRTEGFAMLKNYANHPSFVLFSPGNEIWSGHERVEENMLAFEAYDPRPLYAMGSNNNIGYEPPHEYSEFFIGSRVPGLGGGTEAHTRLTHAFADAEAGGILNSERPSTDFNFDVQVSHLSIPLISHEIGQYQIYPDYSEIEKYTGVLRAWNLEVFRKRLEERGMGNMDSLFQQASGAWSAICYKAEMEAAIRTSGMAGFQLLDLQDFPGQGTALVGVLDAFMDSKNVISQEKWKQSCNDVVLLVEFSKYCWANVESFKAALKIANYSNKVLNGDLNWVIKKHDESVLRQGTLPLQSIKNGAISDLGAIEVEISAITKPERLNIEVSIPNTSYSNSYPLWVYPATKKVVKPEDILVTDQWDQQLVSQLEKGAKALLFPKTEVVKSQSYPGHFPPDFWNYGMFKSISENMNKAVSPGTLGLLMDPTHPIFENFPTDVHTNWQWFSIIKNSNSLILDKLPHDYFPIVEVIDNLERNHKLGLIFEFKVGNGKLLVCMSSLNHLEEQPEAVQLYQSILNYMDSEYFNPQYSPDMKYLESLF